MYKGKHFSGNKSLQPPQRNSCFRNWNKSLYFVKFYFFHHKSGASPLENCRLFLLITWLKSLQLGGMKETLHLTYAEFHYFSVGNTLSAWSKQEISESESFSLLSIPCSLHSTIDYPQISWTLTTSNIINK